MLQFVLFMLSIAMTLEERFAAICLYHHVTREEIDNYWHRQLGMSPLDICSEFINNNERVSLVCKMVTLNEMIEESWRDTNAIDLALKSWEMDMLIHAIKTDSIEKVWPVMNCYLTN